MTFSVQMRGFIFGYNRFWYILIVQNNSQLVIKMKEAKGPISKPQYTMAHLLQCVWGSKEIIVQKNMYQKISVPRCIVQKRTCTQNVLYRNICTQIIVPQRVLYQIRRTQLTYSQIYIVRHKRIQPIQRVPDLEKWGNGDNSR